MIDDTVIANAATYRDRFQSAKPFKHVCIDNFFQPDAVAALLRDFPKFDRENARNEFGEYGGKAVVSAISNISTFYAKVYEYLFTRDFLNAMSEITGIPALQGDPTLFGGGTHENLEGQELDPHVDFNFQIEGGFHRRINLLLYLNEEWDPAWGGALELHSNPRRPEENRILEYNVIFNRAVIFETNEYSWHGFRKIQLPPQDKNLSRKCLSIYLYTKERPSEEIAGPHATFYVQRPLTTNLEPGYPLTTRDIQEIRTGIARRDRQIEMYQRLEERLGRQLEDLKRHLHEVESSVRIPLLGWAKQIGPSVGIYHDGWATSHVEVGICCTRKAKTVSIQGFIPEYAPRGDRSVAVAIDTIKKRLSIASVGDFSCTCDVDVGAGATVKLQLDCDVSFKPSELGAGNDMRSLSYLLTCVTVE